MSKHLILFLSFCHSVFADDHSAAAIIHAKLGLLLLQKGFYGESKASLLQALHDDAHIAAPWYGMAYYLEKTGHASLADRYYRQAITVAPHSAAAKNNYGVFLCRHGKYVQAVHEFVSAALEPQYLHVATAYKNAGLCAMKIPNQSWAKYYFEKARQNDPH